MTDLKGKCYRCTACGEHYVGSLALKTCEACRTVECHDCVNREGVCVPCGDLIP